MIWLLDEASKVDKSSAKGRFAVKWSEFVIVTTYFNVKKQYGNFIFNHRSESDVFMLTI